jgi:hypothetical protein
MQRVWLGDIYYTQKNIVVEINIQMSSTYNTWFEQAFIPCNQSSANVDLEAGTAQVNVDGVSIMGGIKVDGKCFTGGYSTREKGFVPGNNQLFYLAGFSPARYSGTRNPVSSNAHIARSTRANYL